MLKKFAKRIGLKFNQSKSDRNAGNSYRNYHQRVKKMFERVNPFTRTKKNY